MQPKIKIIDDYSIHMSESLGKGQFGHVYKCWKNEQPEHLMACKIITRSQLNKSLQEHLANEISLLKKINSPHLIKLIKIYSILNSGAFHITQR